MNHRIKIAMVLNSFGIGGGEKIAVQLAAYLNKNKFDVTLFVQVSDPNNALSDYARSLNINCLFMGYDHGWSLTNFIEFSKKIKSFDPDIIHTHMDVRSPFIWAKINRKPLIYSLHCQPWRITNWKEKFLIRHSVNSNRFFVIGCANTISDEFVNIFKIVPERIFTIYNPIDCVKYHSNRNYNSKKIIFISVGRLIPCKNHNLLIRSFARLEKSYPNVELWLIGDGNLREELKATAKKLGVIKKVIFHGIVNNIPDMLSQADVFVMSSDTEACPISMLEAMASGLPIISTKVGGIPELVENNGLLVEVQNEKAMFEFMYAMCINPKQRQQMGDALSLRANKFDKSRVVRLYECLYEDINNKFSNKE